MAIHTTIQPRFLYLKPLYALMCLGLGIWGWYDYSVTVPDKIKAFNDHAQLTKRKQELESIGNPMLLPEGQKEEYGRINAELASRFKDAPVMPAAYDRPMQLWLYVIGCGVVGTPMFLWPLLRIARKRYSLEDDGTLRTPEGSCPIADVRAIDMGRWMSKSIAVVTLADGTTSTLDDYQFKGMHLIVGAIAHRLHPDAWTEDARQVKGDADEGHDDDEGDRDPATAGESDDAVGAADAERRDT